MIVERIIETPSDWLLLLLWLAIAVVLWSGLRKQKNTTPLRRWTKIVLHIALWIALGGLLWQPRWQQTTHSQRLLCYSNDVPSAKIKAIQDSLGITVRYDAKTLLRKIVENPTLEQKIGEIYWLGQDFSPAFLAKFHTPKLHWIPYFAENTLQDLSWTGVLAKGNKQQITGSIALATPQMLRLQYANTVLDSVMLPKGFSKFSLTFPVFALGKNHWQLSLGTQTLYDIRFFSFPTAKQQYLFVLSNPDFESKTLADWLGRQGHQVEMLTQVAKNTTYKVEINTTQTPQTFDCIITDASQANNPLVKKGMTAGKSVLFMNFTNPEQELRQINQALGTTWAVQRTSNQENRIVAPGLTALPYRFIEKPLQQPVFDEMAVQKKQGKVGVSLLQETFGLMLSGDSLRYAKIWYNTLQALLAKPVAEAQVKAPLLPQTNIQIAFAPSNSKQTFINTDTIYTLPNPLQQAQQIGWFVPDTTGWQRWQDTLGLYIEAPTSPLLKTAYLSNFLANSQATAMQKKGTDSTLFQALADEYWYLLIVLIMTLLWLETKL